MIPRTFVYWLTDHLLMIHNKTNNQTNKPSSVVSGTSVSYKQYVSSDDPALFPREGFISILLIYLL